MQQNNLTPYEMLDKTLDWFAMDVDKMGLGVHLLTREWVSGQAALKDMVEIFRELNTVEFLLYSELILNKLVSDGYLMKHPPGYDHDMYSITFEGKLLSINGGYKKLKINAALSEKRKNQNEKLLIWGSWLAGIGTILLFAIEFYKLICY